jgi:Tol biopolymer transport system component/DNA-binding winged helix-turn-helix (wHTH) protein
MVPTTTNSQGIGTVSEDAPSVVWFGDFELDLEQLELRRHGAPVRLPPQPLRILSLLLSHAGRIVTREEIQGQVWGSETFVDFELGLNRCIRQIRAALGDNPEQPRFIETIPKRGYRFVAAVEKPSADNSNGMGASVPWAAAAAPRPRPVLSGWPLALMTLGGALAILGGLAILRPTVEKPSPKLLRVVRLTHFGRAELAGSLATDGTSIYFDERLGGNWGIARVSKDGGEPTAIKVPFPQPFLCDYSSQRSELLVLSDPDLVGTGELWIVPVGGGSPRRVGDIVAASATWSPDGSAIAYCSQSSVYEVNPDGSGRRKLLTLASGFPGEVRWEPGLQGGSLTIVRRDPKTESYSLWEASAGGEHLHSVLEGWRPPAASQGEGEYCGRWTPDGKYLIFCSFRNGASGIWAVPGANHRFTKSGIGPLQLYSTSMLLSRVLPSADGRRIFFVASQPARELERYDSGRHAFVPYLSGVPARWVSFSADGQWVAYCDFSDAFHGTVWRSRMDGSQALQLTFAPMNASGPRWSPNGRQIAFSAETPGKGTAIYLVASSGGEPERVVPPNERDTSPSWSPKGDELLFCRMSSDPPALYQVKLKTRLCSLVPNSQHLSSEYSLSPYGRYVAAVADGSVLWLLDLKTHRRSVLIEGRGLSFPYWSPDGRYVYIQELLGNSQEPIRRVRVSDGRVETVATAENFLRSDIAGYSLTGITPDGSPLVSFIRATGDLYALDVSLP